MFWFDIITAICYKKMNIGHYCIDLIFNVCEYPSFIWLPLYHRIDKENLMIFHFYFEGSMKKTQVFVLTHVNYPKTSCQRWIK